MSSKRKMNGAGVLVAAVVLSGVAGCDHIGAWVKDNRYSPLVPPTNMLGPGTIVEALSNDWQSVGIVCTQTASLGPVKPVQSQSKTQTLSKTLKSSFSLDPEYLEFIKADASFQSVREIQLQLADVNVYEVSWDQVFDNLKYRSDGCRQALQVLKSKPDAKFSMITSVIQANVTYDVKFDSSASLGAQAKQELLKGLAASLGAKVSENGSESIQGTALFWGMRDNAALARVDIDTQREMNVATKGLDEERIVPVQFLKVKMEPQVP